MYFLISPQLCPSRQRCHRHRPSFALWRTLSLREDAFNVRSSEEALKCSMIEASKTCFCHQQWLNRQICYDVPLELKTLISTDFFFCSSQKFGVDEVARPPSSTFSSISHKVGMAKIHVPFFLLNFLKNAPFSGFQTLKKLSSKESNA